EEIGAGDRAQWAARTSATRSDDAARAVADVLRRALDPRVAPCRIFLRHPHHEALDLMEDAAPAWPRVRPLPSNELPMPAQPGVGRRDRGDLAQGRTAHPVRARGQPLAIIVGETQ